MTSKQRRMNVDASINDVETPSYQRRCIDVDTTFFRRCIDVDTTLFRRHVLT